MLVLTGEKCAFATFPFHVGGRGSSNSSNSYCESESWPFIDINMCKQDLIFQVDSWGDGFNGWSWCEGWCLGFQGPTNWFFAQTRSSVFLISLFIKVWSVEEHFAFFGIHEDWEGKMIESHKSSWNRKKKDHRKLIPIRGVAHEATAGWEKSIE